jgi:hypothetical protein
MRKKSNRTVLGQDTNLDRGFSLRPRCHRHHHRRLTLHIATDIVSHPFREDAIAARLSLATTPVQTAASSTTN